MRQRSSHSQDRQLERSNKVVSCEDPEAPAGGAVEPRDLELLDDGQEEVFSRSAVEQGVVKDPKALGPEDLARAPTSPVKLGRS